MSEDRVATAYLDSTRERFRTMKRMGELAMEQMSDDDLLWTYNEECNSVAVLVQHLHGNMLSRWTESLTTDGEKADRDRDSEFVIDGPLDREALMGKWEEGWSCLLDALDAIGPDDLLKDVQIRGQKLALLDGISRQIFHVSLHVGQIIHVAKERLGGKWKTLSIPRGKSKEYIPTRKD